MNRVFNGFVSTLLIGSLLLGLESDAAPVAPLVLTPERRAELELMLERLEINYFLITGNPFKDPDPEEAAKALGGIMDIFTMLGADASLCKKN